MARKDRYIDLPFQTPLSVNLSAQGHYFKNESEHIMLKSNFFPFSKTKEDEFDSLLSNLAAATDL